MNDILRSITKAVRKLGIPIGKGRSRRNVRIQPYLGFGTPERVYLRARVLEEKPLRQGKEENRWRNLVNSYRRFETDEVPGAKVEIRVANDAFQLTSDYEGYLELHTSIQPLNQKAHGWREAEYRLLETPQTGPADHRTNGEFLVPDPKAAFGIISDVDDTVLQSHMTSRFRLRMLYATLFQSARRRQPMEGTVELYKELASGRDGSPRNPIFYVSHSPWNLYDLLVDFLSLRQFPKGPVFLRDYGIRPAAPFAGHKVTTIARIMDMYPSMSFVLLGDTASRDADHYLEIARKYPQQVRAIYIRRTSESRNARRIERLFSDTADVEVAMVKSSAEIRAHARKLGLI